MGWCDESGQHEGWVQPIFMDGEEGTGTTNGNGVIFDSVYENGSLVSQRVRPFSEISHVRARCECGWAGETVALADLPAELVDQKYREPTEEGERRFHAEWKRHAAPHDALYGLSGLTAQRNRLEEEIGAQVDAARAAGASWAEIGRELGVTKQAAQQRYART